VVGQAIRDAGGFPKGNGKKGRLPNVETLVDVNLKNGEMEVTGKGPGKTDWEKIPGTL